MLPIGLIAYFGVQPPPSGWVEAGGQALSRIKFADLFRVYGTAYGVGDGSTTFNVPDLRGRVVAGPNSMGGDTEARLTNPIEGGVDGGAIGNVGGVQVATMAIHQLPAGCPVELSTAEVQAGTGATVVNGSVNNGDGDAHNNIPPTIIIPAVIYTGVFG